ncbi:MAG: NAD-dependent epimerase/dehydratase family protein [bacterium]
MENKNIAVIGGSGFIGTRLVASLLDSGHNVKIIDKQQSATYPQLSVNGDVRSVEDLVKGLEGCQVIFNLAAEHKDDVRPVSLYDDVNVQGARNVCIAAEQLGINTIIFTSTVAIYGFSEQELDEQAENNFINDYGRTKLEAEGVYLEWVAKGSKRNLRMVRPTAVFGETNRGNVYNLINQLSKKHFVMVGKGTNRKSIAYVGNICACLEYLMSLDGAAVQIFNYADKPDLQMNDLVVLVREVFGFGATMPLRVPAWLLWPIAAILDLIAVIFNKSFPISRVRIYKFCSNSQFSADRLAASGFKPKYDLKDALRQTIRAEFDLPA